MARRNLATAVRVVAERWPAAGHTLRDARRIGEPSRAGRRPRPGDRRLAVAARRVAPFVVAAALLVLGFLRYAPGAAYSFSGDAYRAYAFPAFRYSDVIWLWLRDGLAERPVPYLDYALEYPPLTGLLSYALSFAPDLPSYFALAYATLAACVIGTVVVVGRLPGASRWYLAAAPTLYLYPGYQWDPAAVFATAVALLLFHRGRDRWGAVAVAAAVWLKFFPLAFLAAVLVDRARARRWRSAFEIGGLVALVSIAVNLPFALANRANWAFFYEWNRTRPADSGIWVLFRDELTTAEATRAAALLVAAGGLALVLVALRARCAVTIPLGATLLLWWLAANKTFTAHLMLWVFLALALLRPPLWIWVGMALVDLFYFQAMSYINLSNLENFRHDPLISRAWLHLLDVAHLLRVPLLLLAAGWGVLILRQRVELGPAPWPPWRELLSVRAWPPRSDAGTSAANGRVGTVTLVAAPLRPILPIGAFRGRLGGRVVPIVAALLRRWRWGAAVTIAYAAATVLMTWPYPARLGSATIVGVDALQQVWIARWVQHALLTQPLRLYDANVFHPFDLSLAYADSNLPAALLAAPIYAATGNALLANGLLVLGSFVLAAGGMYALVAHLTGNRAAGLLAGLAFAFLPYRMVQLWHLNQLGLAWLPWLLLALLRLLDRPSRRSAMIFGVLAAIQALTSLYLAFHAALAIGVVLAVAAVARPAVRSRRVLRHLALGCGLAALLVVPVVAPYLQVRERQGLERTALDAEYWKARPSSYLKRPPWDGAPAPWDPLSERGENLAPGLAPHVDGHRHLELVIEDALYPGLLVLAGAVLGVVWWRRRPATAIFCLIAVVAFVLSLGPSWGPADGTGTPLPYRFLFDHFPFFTAMRVPARFGGLVLFALVALAGLGVAAAWERLAPIVDRRSPMRRSRLAAWHTSPRAGAAALTAVVAALLLVETYAAPLPLETVDRGLAARAPYEWLARQPDDGAVIEFPFERQYEAPSGSSVRRHNGLAMYWSTLHWKPLVNANSGFIPPAYDDLVAAFSGDLTRPDGSLAPQVSHVGPEHVDLLAQLGVRYLLFHRSRYAPADWPLVEARLAAAEGTIEKAGDFGEATIYRLRPTVRPSERTARLTVYAPTLLTADAPWAPAFVTAKPDPSPSLFSVTRPARLSLIWYDLHGREVGRDGTSLALPPVVAAPRLLCSATACREAPDLDAPDDLAPPRVGDGRWHPVEPGHYTVKLAIDGDVALRCTIELDIVAAAEIDDAWQGNPNRWAECVEGEDYPINDPGRLPFDSPAPSVTFIDGRIALDATLEVRRDEEVRAWFLLAPPGSSEPWRHARYRSPAQQRLAREEMPAEFEWLEEVGPEVPPGVYGLTVWFHHRDGGAWEHAYGSGYELAPVVVDANGSLRWAGPVRVALADLLPTLRPGGTSQLRLRVHGDSSAIDCEASWRLVTPDGAQVVAGGHAGACDRPRVRLPETVSPGRYRLELTAFAVRDGQRRVSDGLSLPATVVDGSRGGTPR